MFHSMTSMNTKYYCLMLNEVPNKQEQLTEINYAVKSLINKTIDKAERKVFFPGRTF